MRKNWRTAEELSHWSGVTVNVEGRVVKLDLSNEKSVSCDTGEEDRLTGERLQCTRHHAAMQAAISRTDRDADWAILLVVVTGGFSATDNFPFHSGKARLTSSPRVVRP